MLDPSLFLIQEPSAFSLRAPKQDAHYTQAFQLRNTFFTLISEEVCCSKHKNIWLTLIVKNPWSFPIRGFVFKGWRWPTLTWGSPTLPSAILLFTSEFGMGSGGSKALWSSAKLAWFVVGLMTCLKSASRGPNRVADYKVVLMLCVSFFRWLLTCPAITDCRVRTHQLIQLYGQASRAISTG